TRPSTSRASRSSRRRRRPSTPSAAARWTSSTCATSWSRSRPRGSSTARPSSSGTRATASWRWSRELARQPRHDGEGLPRALARHGPALLAQLPQERELPARAAQGRRALRLRLRDDEGLRLAQGRGAGRPAQGVLRGPADHERRARAAVRLRLRGLRGLRPAAHLLVRAQEGRDGVLADPLVVGSRPLVRAARALRARDDRLGAGRGGCLARAVDLHLHAVLSTAPEGPRRRPRSGSVDVVDEGLHVLVAGCRFSFVGRVVVLAARARLVLALVAVDVLGRLRVVEQDAEARVERTDAARQAEEADLEAQQLPDLEVEDRALARAIADAELEQRVARRPARVGVAADEGVAV